MVLRQVLRINVTIFINYQSQCQTLNMSFKDNRSYDNEENKLHLKHMQIPNEHTSIFTSNISDKSIKSSNICKILIGKDFKSHVASIQSKNDQSRRDVRDRLSKYSIPSEIITPVDSSTNFVTKILTDNDSFRKKNIEIEDVINKKKKTGVWCASLFFADDDKAEFPERRHVCWNNKSMRNSIKGENNIESKHVENTDEMWEGIAHVQADDTIIRSAFSINRELLSVSEEMKVKYFGENAKKQFYETYQELQNMSNLVVGGLDGVESLLQNQTPMSLETWSHCSYQSGRSSNFQSRRESTRTNDRVPSLSHSRKSSIMNVNSLKQFGDQTPNVAIMKNSLRNSLRRSTSSEKPRPLTLPQLAPPFIANNNNSSGVGCVDNDILQHHDGSMHSVFHTNYNQRSPRATFLIGCLRNKFPPRSLAMLRNKFTTKLDLSHLGLGDDLIMLLSKAVADLPLLESISLKDNNLTDRGLEVIIDSIAKLQGIVELDLSSNKVGHNAAKSLGRFITKPSCPIIRLSLSEDCLEDNECSMIVECLKKNPTLQVLRGITKLFSLGGLFSSLATVKIIIHVFWFLAAS